MEKNYYYLVTPQSGFYLYRYTEITEQEYLNFTPGWCESEYVIESPYERDENGDPVED